MNKGFLQTVTVFWMKGSCHLWQSLTVCWVEPLLARKWNNGQFLKNCTWTLKFKMFSPAGVVAYAYGPQTTGCVPHWMVAATSGAGGRSALTGGQVPSGMPPGSPTRTGTNSSYPPSAAAYHDLLKRTVKLNELFHPSVIPLPGTLTAENTSPTSGARHAAQQNLRSKQDTPRFALDASSLQAGQDRRSTGVSTPHGHGHALSPTAVQSKDLKFGIDQILHPSRARSDSPKGKPFPQVIRLKLAIIDLTNTTQILPLIWLT